MSAAWRPPASTSRTSAGRWLRSLTAGAAGLAVAGACLAGCSSSTSPGGSSGPGGRPVRPAAGSSAAGSLVDTVAVARASCPDLLAAFRRRAQAQVGPYGLQPVLPLVAAPGAAGPATVPGVASSSAAGLVAASAGVSSRPQVQVTGVDEADLARLRGDLLVWVGGDRLRVSRLAAGRSSTLGQLSLPAGAGWQLLLAGDRALVLRSDPAPGPAGPLPGALPEAPVGPSTTALQVDLRDPARPRLLSTTRLPGELLGARLDGGTVRLVLGTQARGPVMVTPQGTGDADRAAALAANRQAVARSTLADWLPRLQVGESGGTSQAQDLLACGDVVVPRSGRDLGLLVLSTLDLGAAGPPRWRSAAVLAGAGTVYATGSHTWVATSQWPASPVGVVRPLTAVAVPPEAPVEPPAAAAVLSTSSLYLFDNGRPGAPPTAVASGQVPGTLLDRYAMDEHDGVLRVATTTTAAHSLVTPGPGPAAAGRAGPAASAGAPGPVRTPGRSGSFGPVTALSTQSRVTTVRVQGSRLEQVGVLTGLGPQQSIRSVRFLGDRAYVVTFERVDPLFVLDLSDPRHPRRAGALELTGYSSFLQPLTGGRLLGVGRDIGPDGADRGLQLSLLDVGDPSRPRLLDRVVLPASWSPVETDPQAFTLAGTQAVLPVQGPSVGVDGGADASSGSLVLLPVAGPSLQPVRSVPTGGQVLRTVVLDGVVYSLALDAGRWELGAHALTDGHRLG